MKICSVLLITRKKQTKATVRFLVILPRNNVVTAKPQITNPQTVSVMETREEEKPLQTVGRNGEWLSLCEKQSRYFLGGKIEQRDVPVILLWGVYTNI